MMRYSNADLCDWLATLTPPTPPEAPPRAAHHTADPYAANALRNALGDVLAANTGERNDTLNRQAFGLFGLVKAGRLDDAAVTERLTQAGAAIGLPASEIATTLDSARNAATPRHEGSPPANDNTWRTDQPPPDRPRWAKVISLDDLEDAEPPFFRTAEVLPAGTTTLLGAHGGTGKSMLALQWAVCIALGRPFMGKETHAGRVLLYSAEDDGARVRHRLLTICQRESIDPATLAGRLLLLDATDIDPSLYAEALDRRTFATTYRYDLLREEAERFGADVVMIDNASDTYDADEIDRARVRAFIRSLNFLAKERGAAVLLLSHVDKNTAKGSGDKEGYSGSTAWHNSVRSRLFMTSKDGSLLLEHQKCNLGPCAAPMALAWRDGVIVGEGDALPMGDSGRAFTKALDQAAILRLLQEFAERGEYVSPAPNSPANARKMLGGQPGYPASMKRGGAIFDLLRDAQRAGYLDKETYRDDVQRKIKERWRVTDSGKELAGIAPSAPSAPTPEDGATEPASATEHGAAAPSAPSGAGVLGGGARTN